MKKNNVLLCALFCTNINIQTQLKLEPFKSKTDTPKLSFYQDFQLDYLSHELNQRSKIIASDWTDNEKTQLLIEQLELDVKESSKGTKEFMKKRIIQLFNDYEINIFFTSDNSIQRVTPKKTQQKNTRRIHRAHENDDEPDSSTAPHYHFHSLSDHDDQDVSAQDHIEETHFEETGFKKTISRLHHKKTDTTPTVMAPTKLHRIHGARRTLNRIKRRLAENEKREKELRNKIKQESTLTDKTKQEQTSLTNQEKQQQNLKEQIERDKARIKQLEEKLAPKNQGGERLTQPRLTQPGLAKPEKHTFIKPRKESWQEHLEQEHGKQQHTIDSEPESDPHEAPEHIIFP